MHSGTFGAEKVSNQLNKELADATTAEEYNNALQALDNFEVEVVDDTVPILREVIADVDDETKQEEKVVKFVSREVAGTTSWRGRVGGLMARVTAAPDGKFDVTYDDSPVEGERFDSSRQAQDFLIGEFGWPGQQRAWDKRRSSPKAETLDQEDVVVDDQKAVNNPYVEETLNDNDVPVQVSKQPEEGEANDWLVLVDGEPFARRKTVLSAVKIARDVTDADRQQAVIDIQEARVDEKEVDDVVVDEDIDLEVEEKDTDVEVTIPTPEEVGIGLGDSLREAVAARMAGRVETEIDDDSDLGWGVGQAELDEQYDKEARNRRKEKKADDNRNKIDPTYVLNQENSASLADKLSETESEGGYSAVQIKALAANIKKIDDRFKYNPKGKRGDVVASILEWHSKPALDNYEAQSKDNLAEYEQLTNDDVIESRRSVSTPEFLPADKASASINRAFEGVFGRKAARRMRETNFVNIITSSAAREMGASKTAQAFVSRANGSIYFIRDRMSVNMVDRAMRGLIFHDMGVH